MNSVVEPSLAELLPRPSSSLNPLPSTFLVVEHSLTSLSFLDHTPSTSTAPQVVQRTTCWSVTTNQPSWIQENTCLSFHENQFLETGKHRPSVPELGPTAGYTHFPCRSALMSKTRNTGMTLARALIMIPNIPLAILHIC